MSLSDYQNGFTQRRLATVTDYFNEINRELLDACKTMWGARVVGEVSCSCPSEYTQYKHPLPAVPIPPEILLSRAALLHYCSKQLLSLIASDEVLMVRTWPNVEVAYDPEAQHVRAVLRYRLFVKRVAAVGGEEEAELRGAVMDSAKNANPAPQMCQCGMCEYHSPAHAIIDKGRGYFA